jgi:hypothetical protein
VRDGVEPTTAPHYERDQLSRTVKDEFLNTQGGLRLPPVDVPIAGYTQDGCAPLQGKTNTIDPVRLSQLYSGGRYLPLMEQSVAQAVGKGWLLPQHATELLQRAQAAPAAQL